MKQNLLCVLALSGLCAVWSGSLQAQTYDLRVRIPFEFAVGEKTAPAGEYVVSYRPSGVVKFQDAGGANSLVAMALMSSSNQNKGGPVLIFNRYGERRFLAEIFGGSGKGTMKFYKSGAERDAIKNSPGPGQQVIVESLPAASRP